MRGSYLKADFRRVRYLGLVGGCFLFYCIVGLIYYFTHDSPWVSVSSPASNITLGFLPGKVADPMFVESSYSVVDSAICASVAHTLFLPILIIAFIYIFYFKDSVGDSSKISLARGMSRIRYLASKVCSASITLFVFYISFSISVIIACCLLNQIEPTSSIVAEVFLRMLLNCLVSQSFILLCFAAFSITRSGFVASGFVFVVAYAGLIVQLSLSHGQSIPVHMSYWVKICSASVSAAELVPTFAFSLITSIAFGLISLAGLSLFGDRKE